VSLFETLLDAEAHEAATRPIFGVAVGIVTNNKDPEGLGRVKVKLPWLSDADESDWARVAAPGAGKDRGICFLPEVGDEVLVAFEHGDSRSPYVLGGLWNGKDTPPAKNDDGQNSIRLIKSRSGHTIKLNDEAGKETIEITDKSKKNSILIDTSKNTITITSEKDITLAASNGTIKLDAKEIQLRSSVDTKIEAGSNLSLKASGKMEAKASSTMTIKGSMVNIN